MLQTEITFQLPRGYIDEYGRLHQLGRMRMATVMDEIAPNNHPQVQENESYALILLMSRVITQLGDLPQVNTAVIERLFAADMAYLEDLYLRLNAPEQPLLGVGCPHCHNQFQVEMLPVGR